MSEGRCSVCGQSGPQRFYSDCVWTGTRGVGEVSFRVQGAAVGTVCVWCMADLMRRAADMMAARYGPRQGGTQN